MNRQFGKGAFRMQRRKREAVNLKESEGGCMEGFGGGKGKGEMVVNIQSQR